MIWLFLLLLSILIALSCIRIKRAIRRVKKEQIAREKQEDQEDQEKEDQEYQKFSKEQNDKILFMQNLGLKKVIGVYQKFWIRRENNKIKELYDLESNRIPLATLIIAPGAKTIGIVPDLYYYGEKISKQQMLEDEEEIRKLNSV